MKPNKRENENACDCCGQEKIVLLTLANGLKICPACRKEK